MLTQWRGKDILDPKHAEHLDRHAAELEFGKNMSRPDAEEKAYKDYRVKNYIEAAAHHWKAFTAASAVADPSSKEHKMMYDVYMRALGHNPAGPVPPEVKQVLPDVNQKRTKFMAQKRTKFMAHAADQLPLLRSELNQILPLAKLLVKVMSIKKNTDYEDDSREDEREGPIGKCSECGEEVTLQENPQTSDFSWRHRNPYHDNGKHKNNMDLTPLLAPSPKPVRKPVQLSLFKR